MSDDVALSVRQRAILAPDVRLVEACPGAGKTRAIVARFRQQSASSKRGVALLSFTNAAVNEAARRCADNPTLTEAPNFVGTFDSFLHRYVVSPWFLRSRLRMPRYMDSWSDLPEEWGRVRHAGVQGRGLDLASFIPLRDGSFVVSSDLSGSDRVYANQLAAKQYSPDDLVGIAMRKVRELLESGLYDCDQARLEALRVLEDQDSDWLRRRLVNRFEEIIIDEFQDCSDIEHKIVEALEESGIRVVVVADPDQSIYEFRRATPAAFQDFRTRFAPCEIVVLNEDYRSSEAICQVVTSLRSVGHDRIQSKANFSGLPFASSVYVIAGDSGFQRQHFAALADRFEICQNGRVVLASTRAAAAELSGQPSVTRKVTGASGRLLQALSVLGYSGAGEARRVAVLRIERMLLDSFAWGGALERGSVDQRLEVLGIDRTYLRFVTRRLLVSSGTWASREEAHTQVKALLVETLTPLCVPTKQIGRRFGAIDPNDWKFWLDARSNEGKDGIKIQALHIHAVKGAEFEAVLLGFVDQKPRGRPHVLDTWALSNTSEDRRVIYVGASRAQRLLAFAVSPKRRAALEQILIHDSVPFETISAP